MNSNPKPLNPKPTWYATSGTGWGFRAYVNLLIPVLFRLFVVISVSLTKQVWRVKAGLV